MDGLVQLTLDGTLSSALFYIQYHGCRNVDFNLTQDRTRECIRTESLVILTILIKYQITTLQKKTNRQGCLRHDFKKHILFVRLVFYHYSCFCILFYPDSTSKCSVRRYSALQIRILTALTLKLLFVQSYFASEQTYIFNQQL